MKKFILSFLLLSPIIVRSCPDDLVSYTVDETHLPLVKRLASYGSAQLNMQEPPVYVTGYLTSSDIVANVDRIFIDPSFANNSYPVKKMAVFNTLNLCRQQTPSRRGQIRALKPSVCQQAETNAFLMANCPACAHDVSCSCEPVDQRNLTTQELINLAQQLKNAPLCAYHRAVADRFTYRLVNWIYFLGSKVCPENRVTNARMNTIAKMENKLARGLNYAWVFAISVPTFINKSFFELANRWIGRDVEKIIAKGELAV